MGRSIFFRIGWTILILTGWLFVPWPATVQAETLSNHVVFLPLVSNTNNQASAPVIDGELPTLDEFILQAHTGNSHWSGVFVADKMAFKIVQQPDRRFEFISSAEKEVKQFMLAVPDVVGLLAHNHLAGKSFFDFEVDDRVYLINGRGEFKEYVVKEIASFRAIDPFSPTSMFEDLESGEMLDTAQVFSRFYMGGAHLTLQTCIYQDGNASWGRLFITALPVNAEYTE